MKANGVTTVWIALLGLCLAGCQSMSSLSGDGAIPYGKETQLAYFEGQGHLLKGDLEDAYASFLKCADAEPDEMAFHYQLGKIDLELKRFEAAELHFNRAASLEPNNSWVLYHRGKARLGQGDGGGAEQDWTPFVTARPGDLESLFECTELLLMEGHVLPTLNLLSNYEEQVGRDEDVRTEALRIVEQTADPEGVGQFLQRAKQDFPESDLFQLQWARYLMATGDLDACEVELIALTNRRPDWGKVQFEWAEYHTLRDDLPAALPYIEKAMSSDDVALESKIRVLLGYGFLAQENPEFHAPYTSLLDRMMTHHGEEPAVVEMACDWAYQNQRLDEALELALTLVELAPSSSETWTNLMAIRVDLKDWDAMVEDAEQALARFPLDPVLFYFHGIALRETQQNTQSVKAFKSGLNVVLDNPVLEGAMASQLGWVYRNIGELDLSEKAFERSIGAIEDAIVLNNHAYFLATRKDVEATTERLQRALECSTRANELAPNEGNFMDTQAHVLFMMGSYDEALQWILAAQDHGMAGDPVALEHEGDIRWELGQKNTAREVWRQAIENGGDKDVLQRKIDRQ